MYAGGLHVNDVSESQLFHNVTVIFVYKDLHNTSE